MSNRKICLPVILCALVWGTVPDARAGSISYTTSFQQVGGGMNVNGLTGNFSSNILDFALMQLPRFDSSMGTLQGVQLSYATQYAMGIFEAGAYDTFEEGGLFSDYNDAGITAYVVGSFYLQLFDPSSSSTTINKPVLGTDCYTTARDGNGNSSCVAPNVYESGALNGNLPVAALGLLSFIGNDPINLLAQVTGRVYGSCDSNDDGNSLHDQDACYIVSSGVGWSGDVSVLYTFDAQSGNGGGGGGGGSDNTVPEPGSFALLGVGLAGIGAMRRKKLAA